MNQHKIEDYIKFYHQKKFYDVKLSEIKRENQIPFGEKFVEHLLCKNEKINIILDLTNCKLETRFMQAFKKDGKLLKAKININIAVGATGISYVLLRIYQSYTGKLFKVFRTREEAMKYIDVLN